MQTHRRLVADPSVGVADLMTPVENLVKKMRGKKGEGGDDSDEGSEPVNIYKHIEYPTGATWKSATPIEWMCQHHELFADYVRLAKNTILSGKKHKLALEKISVKNKLSFGKKSLQDCVDYIDDAIRMGLAHYRQCKQSEEKKSLAIRRCTPDMIKKFEGVLDLIDCGAAVEPCMSLVPFEDPVSEPRTSPRSDAPLKRFGSEAEVKEEIPLPGSSTLTIFGEAPERVFDRILQAQDSVTKTPDRKWQKKEKEVKKQDSPNSNQDPFECSLDLRPEDEMLLAKAARVEPLSKDNMSQQQRLNAQKRASKPMKRPAKAAATKLGKRKSKDLSQDEEVEGVDEQKAKDTKVAKGSNTKKSKGKQADQECQTKVQTKEQKGKWRGVATDQLDPRKPEERKVMRHRLTSNAWHTTLKKLVAEGLDADKAKEKAREAAQQKGKEFDKANPKGKGKGKGPTKKNEDERKDMEAEKEEEEKAVEGEKKKAFDVD